MKRILDDQMLVGEVDRPLEDHVGHPGGADDLVLNPPLDLLLDQLGEHEVYVATERDRAEDRHVDRWDAGIGGVGSLACLASRVTPGQRRRRAYGRLCGD